MIVNGKKGLNQAKFAVHVESNKGAKSTTENTTVIRAYVCKCTLNSW